MAKIQHPRYVPSKHGGCTPPIMLGDRVKLGKQEGTVVQLGLGDVDCKWIEVKLDDKYKEFSNILPRARELVLLGRAKS